MSVLEKCQLEWESHKSDCSGFVKAVAADLGITLTGQADDIVDQIAGAGWTSLTDGVAAKAKAEAGFFVLGGIKSEDLTPPRDNGHVVIVVAGALAHDKYPNAWWGTLGGVGKNGATLNWAFNSDDRDDVIYAYRTVP